MSNEDNRACLGTIGLIVAPWKFDILQTSIIVLEALLPSRANICCKNIKISAGQLSADSSQTETLCYWNSSSTE